MVAGVPSATVLELTEVGEVVECVERVKKAPREGARGGEKVIERLGSGQPRVSDWEGVIAPAPLFRSPPPRHDLSPSTVHLK